MNRTIWTVAVGVLVLGRS